MFRFLYWIFKWSFVLLFSIILLLSAAWQLPQTHDGVVVLQERVEERFQIDIAVYGEKFMRHYDKFRGIKRHNN